MPKRVLLFAPAAFNLAETSRMVEIAKGVVRHPQASLAFQPHFISDGGEFENLIENHRFPLTRLEPRLTKEKIEHIARVDRGEKFAPAFTVAEMIDRVDHELACMRDLHPVAVVTGSYVTIPITSRVLHVPLVWVIQSNWLPHFFRHGAGMTDQLRLRPLKAAADWFIWLFTNFWIRYGFLNAVNRAARHYGVPGYSSIFDFWRGDLTPGRRATRILGRSVAAGSLLHGTAHSAGRIPDAGGSAEHRQRSAAYLLRDGELRYARNRRADPGELRRETVPGDRTHPVPDGAGRWSARTFERAGDRLAARAPGEQNGRPCRDSWRHRHRDDSGPAGRPVAGVGMQMEQVANLACLERLGFAIRIRKSRDPSAKVQEAIRRLLGDDDARARAADFAQVAARWDGPKLSAETLLQRYGREA